MVFKKYFFAVNLQHLYSITDVSAFVGVVVILYVLYCTVHILYGTVLYCILYRQQRWAPAIFSVVRFRWSTI
jgi:hypothetical protein